MAARAAGVASKWLVGWALPAVLVLGGCGDDEASNSRRASADDTDCAQFSFDRSSWRAADAVQGDFPTTRQSTARALVKCETLIGLSRDQVRRLLGDPDDDGGGDLGYSLGAEPSPIGLDSEYLDIEFENHTAVRASISVG